MDIVDRDLLRAESSATRGITGAYQARDPAEIERITSISSASSSSSSDSEAGNDRRRGERGHRSPSVATAATGISAGGGGSALRVPMSRIPTARTNGGASYADRNPTELSRIQTARSQHTGTVGRDYTARRSKSQARRDSRPLPAFGAGKPYPPPLPEREEYVVEFDGPDDPLHAQNWPIRKKFLIAFILGYTTMTSAFGSSIFSVATRAVAREFKVSTEVGILGVSLYVLGFAFGPTLWAPLSELKGRRMPLVVSMFGFSIFNIAVAIGKDLQTVLICRFWAGFFGACPLAVVAAVFSDIFDNRTRGIAITVFSMTVFTGPLLAPFIGGFITDSYLGWRWTEYITSFMGFLAFGLNVIFLEESYAPAILVGKAAELRRLTLNWGIHAKQEEIEIDMRELIQKNFSRPLRMLIFEPIVLLVSVYVAFIYGLLYLFLTAYPLVFQGVHHFNSGEAGLAFFGIIVGQILGGAAILLTQPSYVRKLAANKGIPIPEWRLPPVIAGGALFAGGLFWFGWSGYRADVHWIVPALSGLLTGFGLLSIFLQCINYIVDAYLMFAASALAANTFLRSLFGACFPLFSVYMFDGMGIQWASTLLGCLAAAMVPIPVIFYVYGRRLRRRSRFAPTFPLQPPPEPQEQSAEDARADAIGGPLANDNGAESDGATDQAVDSEKEKDVEVDPALAAAAPRSLTETAAA